jgi:hypothetical protein
MKRPSLTAWVALLALLVPVAVYIAVFGMQVSRDHQRWAEFGSFLSGVYGPLVALATLAVLAMQVRLQRQMNEHEVDRAHIEQSRADIEFYLLRLTDSLQVKLLTGNTVREVLHHQFQPSAIAELDSQHLQALAKQVDLQVPHVLALLHGIFPVLAGMANRGDHVYRVNLNSALQKMIAMLGFEICVALENFHHCRTEGRVPVPYHFSPLLRSE